MADGDERRPSWRIRRPGSTGLLILAFVGVLLLWLQVRPAPTTPVPVSPVTVVVPTSTRGGAVLTATVSPGP